MVVVAVGVVIVLTALPLLARIPLGITAGAALSKEMRWERRSKRNARRAERFVAAATGWWFAALGILTVVAAATTAPRCGTVTALVACGVVLFVIGLPGLLDAFSVWRRE